MLPSSLRPNRRANLAGLNRVIFWQSIDLPRTVTREQLQRAVDRAPRMPVAGFRCVRHGRRRSGGWITRFDCYLERGADPAAFIGEMTRRGFTASMHRSYYTRMLQRTHARVRLPVQCRTARRSYADVVRTGAQVDGGVTARVIAPPRQTARTAARSAAGVTAPKRVKQRHALKGTIPASRFISWNVRTLTGGRDAAASDMLIKHRCVIAALQETHCRDDEAMLSDYNCLSVPADTATPGAHGLMLAAHSSVTLTEAVEYRSLYTIFARATGVCAGDNDGPIIVASVYVPTKKNTTVRVTALTHLEECTTAIAARWPLLPLIVMGDFNMTTAELDRWLAAHGNGLRRVVVDARGVKRGTFAATAKHGETTPDHVVVNMAALRLVGAYTVSDDRGDSDHYPLLLPSLPSTMREPTRISVAQGVRFSRNLLSEPIAARNDGDDGASSEQQPRPVVRLINSGRFQALADTAEDMAEKAVADPASVAKSDVAAVYSQLIDSTRAAAVDAGVVAKAPAGVRRRGVGFKRRVGRATREAIDRRRAADKRLDYALREGRLCLQRAEASCPPASATAAAVQAFTARKAAQLARLRQLFDAEWKRLRSDRAKMHRDVAERYKDDAQSSMARNISLVLEGDARMHLTGFKDLCKAGGVKMRVSEAPRMAIRKSDGTLTASLGEMVKETENHYKALFTPAPGTPATIITEAEWEQRATDAGLQLEQKPLLPDGIMNGRLEWQEVRRVLRAFASGKAADTAGWSAELACAALRDEHGVIHAEAEASACVGDVPDASVMAPPTAFARSLFSVLAIIFETREIPTDAAQALCVSIPKAGGDSSKLSDDRGIQIMPLLIKILTTVVKSRVEAALATRPAGDRTPRREQAGFMPREEAVGQAAALIELLRRRQRQRRMSYLLFVDFSKAFDSVAHAALFLRLRKLGIHGKVLEFIIAVYENACFRVRVGGDLTEVINILVGVRQGDPLSGLLFDLFIDTLIDALDSADGAGGGGATGPIGVEIPGQVQLAAAQAGAGGDVEGGGAAPPADGAAGGAVNTGPRILAALAYADDVSGITSSLERLGALIKKCEWWADIFGLKYGLAKPGSAAPPKTALMAVGYAASASEPTTAHPSARQLMDAAKATPFFIQGQRLEWVSGYKYLGIHVDELVSLGEFRRVRVDKFRKALMMHKRLLENPFVPLRVKRLVFKTYVLPIGMIGGEITGAGSKEWLEPLQEVLHQAAQMMVTGSAAYSRSIHMSVIMRELGLECMWALAVGAHVRARVKWPSLSSLVSIITAAPDAASLVAGVLPPAPPPQPADGGGAAPQLPDVAAAAAAAAPAFPTLFCEPHTDVSRALSAREAADSNTRMVIYCKFGRDLNADAEAIAGWDQYRRDASEAPRLARRARRLCDDDHFAVQSRLGELERKEVELEGQPDKLRKWRNGPGGITRAVMRYVDYEIAEASTADGGDGACGFLDATRFYTYDGFWLNWLFRARTGAIYLMGYQRARIDGSGVPHAFREKCPACGCKARDTIEHIVTVCRAYAAHRKMFLQPLWARVASGSDAAGGHLSEHDKMVAALAGRRGLNCYSNNNLSPGQLPGWLPSGKSMHPPTGDAPATRPARVNRARNDGDSSWRAGKHDASMTGRKAAMAAVAALTGSDRELIKKLPGVILAARGVGWILNSHRDLLDKLAEEGLRKAMAAGRQKQAEAWAVIKSVVDAADAGAAEAAEGAEHALAIGHNALAAAAAAAAAMAAAAPASGAAAAAQVSGGVVTRSRTSAAASSAAQASAGAGGPHSQSSAAAAQAAAAASAALASARRLIEEGMPILASAIAEKERAAEIHALAVAAKAEGASKGAAKGGRGRSR